VTHFHGETVFPYSFAELSDKNLLVTELLLLVVRSGTNCVGAPCGNDQNAFFNSTFFGGNFTSTSNEGPTVRLLHGLDRRHDSRARNDSVADLRPGITADRNVLSSRGLSVLFLLSQ